MKTAFITNDDDTKRDLYSSDWVLVTSNDGFLALPAVVLPVDVPA